MLLLSALPAATLARMIHQGEVKAQDVVQACLDHIEAVNPTVNAFVDVYAEDALAAADQIRSGDERPFAGVPIAIKNNRGVVGKRLTLGSNFMGEFTAREDHNVVRRLRQAGFVIIGSTTVPEFGMIPSTETARFGPTRNPWDLKRTPAGSSGGAAAAVASGMVPIAHANDGGGSTRMPAACCGLVGLKPQRSRISHAPDLGNSFLIEDGVITRTVDDSARALDVLAGYEPGDASWAPPPTKPFALQALEKPTGLRIALVTESLIGADVDSGDLQAAYDAAHLLKSIGHRVDEVTAPWRRWRFIDAFSAVYASAVAAQIPAYASALGKTPTRDDVEPATWYVWEHARQLDAVAGITTETRVASFGRKLNVWMEDYDAILTPALGHAPPEIGVLDPVAVAPDALFDRAFKFSPFTAIANGSGNPAIALPLYERRPDGASAAVLPLGVQLIGKPAGEGALLALASQIESVIGWKERVSPIAR